MIVAVVRVEGRAGRWREVKKSHEGLLKKLQSVRKEREKENGGVAGRGNVRKIEYGNADRSARRHRDSGVDGLGAR